MLGCLHGSFHGLLDPTSLILFREFKVVWRSVVPPNLNLEDGAVALSFLLGVAG